MSIHRYTRVRHFLLTLYKKHIITSKSEKKYVKGYLIIEQIKMDEYIYYTHGWSRFHFYQTCFNFFFNGFLLAVFSLWLIKLKAFFRFSFLVSGKSFVEIPQRRSSS